jgi:excisionase family DNA binding protein
MLLTIKELSEQLRIKPSTLYAWSAQGKIPVRKIHGLLRFHREEIDAWIRSFAPVAKKSSFPPRARWHGDVDHLIESAKRAIYTASGETSIASPFRKEEQDGSR